MGLYLQLALELARWLDPSVARSQEGRMDENYMTEQLLSGSTSPPNLHTQRKENFAVRLLHRRGVKGREMTENDRGTNVERYVGEIKGGLKPAMKITIIGVICSNPKSFAVTLLCDPMDASKDIGLLLAVNFSEKSITRNAQIAGKWGREEKNIPYFPFTAGDTFKMELFCEHQQIRVLLDGRQLCYFTHRVQPLRLVTALQISGDIKLTKVA